MDQQSGSPYPVIFFDGVCNLCSRSVQFVIRHDPLHRFRFASLQSSFAQDVLKKHETLLQNFRSFVLLEDGKLYTRSSAALRVCRKLHCGWKLLYAFIVVPSFIRNAVYDIIASNRYRWFGKKESCWLPRPELKALFLDQEFDPGTKS